MLLLGLRYALLEDIEANGSFVQVYDQRRRQAKRCFSASEEQKTLLEGQGNRSGRAVPGRARGSAGS